MVGRIFAAHRDAGLQILLWVEGAVICQAGVLIAVSDESKVGNGAVWNSRNRQFQPDG